MRHHRQRDLLPLHATSVREDMGDDHDLRDAHVADVTRRIEEYRHYGSGGV